jgi:cell wall-associated NlpC family hydrolase
MKRLTTAGIASVLLLASCSASMSMAIAQPYKTEYEAQQVVEQDGFADLGFIPIEDYQAYAQALAEEQGREMKKRRYAREEVDNAMAIAPALEKIKETVGRTPYVFSGSSPSGWDCSGLVNWVYGHVGVTLPHRASLQAKSGRRVDVPVPGDIVAYFYGSSSDSFHTGIYVGDGNIVHALNPRVDTRMESAENGIVIYGNIRLEYIRVIPLTELRVSTEPRLKSVAGYRVAD